MINNNKFFIEKLNSVVFLGGGHIFSELIEINNSLKLNTLVITTSHQSKSVSLKRVLPNSNHMKIFWQRLQNHLISTKQYLVKSRVVIYQMENQILNKSFMATLSMILQSQSGLKI